MARYAVPYGKGSLAFELPDEWSVQEVVPNPVRPASDPGGVVEKALESPAGNFTWAALASRSPAGRRRGATGLTVAIAINDKTRPVPHEYLLPPLLARLEGAGIRRENITLIVATGTHPPMTPDEFSQILPEHIISRYRVVSHDAEDKGILREVGTTSRGTPLALNHLFLDADVRIVIGNIEPHQFMGFSGGVKSAVIGLAAKETINRNHAMMSLPEALPGRYEDNPPRQDVEEMGEMVRIDLAVNAVLNDKKEIIEVIAGVPTAVMRQGIPRVRRLYELEVRPPFDLVIASPGGHPKDINVYQSQKALAHASLVTKERGAIVVTAACPEGSGSKSYEEWVAERTSHRQVISDFEAEGFRVGPHKAFQVARETVRFHTRWVSDLPSELAARLLLPTAGSVESAVRELLDEVADDRAGGAEDGGPRDIPRVGIMPVANATIATIGGRSIS
jgi:nickel-dependent lactate racemase